MLRPQTHAVAPRFSGSLIRSISIRYWAQRGCAQMVGREPIVRCLRLHVTDELPFVVPDIMPAQTTNDYGKPYFLGLFNSLATT